MTNWAVLVFGEPAGKEGRGFFVAGGGVEIPLLLLLLVLLFK